MYSRVQNFEDQNQKQINHEQARLFAVRLARKLETAQHGFNRGRSLQSLWVCQTNEIDLVSKFVLIQCNSWWFSDESPIGETEGTI
jgi:1,2-phenylacetyl-CoA epoxidase PaaB subunit